MSAWPKIDKLAQQVIEADRVGKSRNKLAREIGINPWALSVICGLLDMPPPSTTHWDHIFQEHPEKTAPELARLLGCDRTIVRNAAKRRGFKLPKGKAGRPIT